MTTGASMDPNPYRPPGAAGDAGPSQPNRTLFMLAAVGAGLASLYWAALTALMALGAAAGSLPTSRIVVPCILIVLYAHRGYLILKGDAGAARRILWLHGLGMVMAVTQMASGNPVVLLLHGVKIAIHLFGGITAFLAQRGR
jgi:hypothetical protein